MTKIRRDKNIYTLNAGTLEKSEATGTLARADIKHRSIPN